jgi:hypothetical protein
MSISDKIDYVSHQINLPSKVPLRMLIGGEQIADGEPGDENQYGASLTCVVGKYSSDYMRMSIHMRHNKEYGETTIFGTTLSNRYQGIAFDDTSSNDTSFPIKHVFEDIFNETIAAYHKLPKEKQDKLFEDFDASLSVEREGDKDAKLFKQNPTIIQKSLQNAKPFSMNNIHGIDQIMDEIKLEPENNNTINKTEKALVTIGMMTHASLLLLGTQIFDKPVQNLMKKMSTNRLTEDFNRNSLLTYLQTVPKDSTRYSNLLKNHWNAIC